MRSSDTAPTCPVMSMRINGSLRADGLLGIRPKNLPHQQTPRCSGRMQTCRCLSSSALATEAFLCGLAYYRSRGRVFGTLEVIVVFLLRREFFRGLLARVGRARQDGETARAPCRRFAGLCSGGGTLCRRGNVAEVQLPCRTEEPLTSIARISSALISSQKHEAP